MKRFAVVIGTSLLLLPMIVYARLHFLRPPLTNIERSLHQGINYKRDIYKKPRPVVVHTVSIDLTAPGVKVLVTPGKPTSSDNTEINARITSDFLKEFKLKLAINASYFYNFRENTPLDYFPHNGDRVNVVGEAISEGDRYSPPETEWPAICFTQYNEAKILNTCPDATKAAVAGREVLINQGKPGNFQSKDDLKPYPRTAVGIDKEGKKLWLVIVDGKQPFYSEGLTNQELTDVFQKLGVYSALNLDGGGSTTLVTDSPEGVKILNSPSQFKLPMIERPVANHIGFYALDK
jgi:exopolysaccharide biosynthesis protein